MFFWCCPRKKKHKQIAQLHQSLIERQRTQTSIIEQPITKTKILNNQQQIDNNDKKSNDDAKSQPDYKKEKDFSQLYQRVNKTDSKANNLNIGIPPNFQKNQGIRLFSPRQKYTGPSKKSHLWKQQLKSDLIYLDSSNGQYIYMSYRLAKNQQSKQCLNGLDYFLSKSQDKIHIIVGKYSMFNSKLSTINKHNQNIINVAIINQGRVSLTDQNFGIAEAILMQDVRNLRWNGINSLVILADSFHTFDEVKQYFTVVVKNLGWQELKKTTFLFPSFMTLQQISKLLFPCMKQFVINSTIEKASLDLVFDMQLIEGTNLESSIIIKCRSDDIKQGSSVYDHLKLSIVFFARQLSELNQKVYIDFYVQMRQKTLQQFCDMKQFYRRNPAQFRHKVKQIRDIEPKVFSDLQNSSPLKQITSQQSGYFYVIANKVREDIGRIYNIAQLQKKQVDTPVKKQWDDDATADDFKTSKTSKLDMVAKQELDQIDLQMGFGDLSDDDPDLKAEQNYRDQIIIKVQENQFYQNNKKDDQNKTFSPSEQNESQIKLRMKQLQNQNRCDRNRRYQRYT